MQPHIPADHFGHGIKALCSVLLAKAKPISHFIGNLASGLSGSMHPLSPAVGMQLVP